MNKALHYFQSSSELGNPRAQYLLGQMYETGAGVLEKDTHKAKALYLKSAKQGYQLSIDRLQALT